MIDTEKTILALTIENPKLVDLFLLNSDMGAIFESVYGQLIFRTIEGFHFEGDGISWDSVRDRTRGQVPESYFVGMLENIRGIPDSLAEAALRERIALLKKQKAKKEILVQINQQVRTESFDFDEIISLAEKGKFVELVKEEANFETAYEEFLDWKRRGKSDITTGLPSFDRESDGFHPGELVGIMGRAATAKTFLAVNIVNHLVRHTPKRIGFFSLEMSKAALIERMIQVFFNKSREQIVAEKIMGQLMIEEFKSRYKSLLIYSRVYSVQEISRLVKKDRIEIAVIDHLQQLKQTKEQSLYENATRNIGGLKEIAKNLDVVIFLLIQLSRKAEGGWEPVTIDMARDSGSIEEVCDFLVGIWSPILREGADSSWAGRLCLKLIKNKRGPQVGIKAHFSRDSGRILEIEENAYQ